VRFHYVCNAWPLFFEYVNDTWIIPYRERFVKAWTDKVMHLRQTMTNRYD